MKTRLALIYGFIFLAGYSAFSQTYVAQVKPVGSKEWGYINTKGELIIPAQYRRCYEFSEEGLAVIYDAEVKRFYFINLKNEKLDTEIKDFRLIEAFGFGLKGFDNGMVPVRVGDLWGYLNTEGKLAIPAKYEDVTVFDGGYAVAEREGVFYVIDKSGNETKIEAPGLIDVKSFSEKLAPYKTEEGKYGFINTNGKPAIQAQYLGVGYFVGGLAWAKTPEETIGFINPQGEWVIKPQFAAVKNFDPESGLARVKSDDNWIYIKKTGEKTPMGDSEIVEDFSNGLAKGRKTKKFGFYNAKGEWVIEPQFDAARDFQNGFAAARKGDKWGLIDKTGKWLVEPTYADMKDVEMVK